MVRDDRETYTSRMTGEVKKGRVYTFGMSVVSDALAMGFNQNGRITPLVGTSIFFSHIDEDGKTPIDAVALTTGEGLAGDGNVHNPVHHHTIQRVPRNCDGCHPLADGGEQDMLPILRAVGLGTGEFTFTDGEGRIHWLDRLVEGDFDGDGQPDAPVEDGVAVPIPEDGLVSVSRLVGTTHPPLLGLTVADVPEPGPLDLSTINLVLKSKVVRQVPTQLKPPPAPASKVGDRPRGEEKNR